MLNEDFDWARPATDILASREGRFTVEDLCTVALPICESSPNLLMEDGEEFGLPAIDMDELKEATAAAIAAAEAEGPKVWTSPELVKDWQPKKPRKKKLTRLGLGVDTDPVTDRRHGRRLSLPSVGRSMRFLRPATLKENLEPDPAAQAEKLVNEMRQQLQHSRGEPLQVRRLIFRDLQRQLHPDKNTECEEARGDANKGRHHCAAAFAGRRRQLCAPRSPLRLASRFCGRRLQSRQAERAADAVAVKKENEADEEFEPFFEEVAGDDPMVTELEARLRKMNNDKSLTLDMVLNPGTIVNTEREVILLKAKLKATPDEDEEERTRLEDKIEEKQMKIVNEMKLVMSNNLKLEFLVQAVLRTPQLESPSCSLLLAASRTVRMDPLVGFL
ncbi:unnamed protein product [Effrenium voratum]|nr:unnamed protein product [Effrenium voratum]